MSSEIREMTSEDYDQAYRLWTECKGLCIGDDDARDRIELYLRRNPGLCFVALSEGDLVGTILCGHDGRRGILRHLAVKQEHRGNRKANGNRRSAVERPQCCRSPHPAAALCNSNSKYRPAHNSPAQLHH